MSDDGLSDLLRLYALLRGTTDPRTRNVIRQEIDHLLDRAEFYVPEARRRSNGHGQSSAP